MSENSKIEAWSRPQGEDEIRSLLERARGGDPSELEALRQAMNRHPEVWQSYGDLAAHAQDAWIDLISGVDLALKESVGRQVEAMKAELVGPAPTPLEALLVERIAACWLQVSYADATAAQTGDLSIQQGNYLRKRQDSAHRRYLTAVGALAMVRRLIGTSDGRSGPTAIVSLALTGPARVDGCDPATDERGEQRTGTVEGNRDEDDVLLEFGSPRSDLLGSGQRRSSRRSKDSSSP